MSNSVGTLLTLKFDPQWNWKIVKTQETSLEEVEREDAGQDVSSPSQTTEQEKPSASASFADTDRHLNEVYNTLRPRLSPSERGTLKKEQLAWINQRDAAATQVSRKNAQENTTEATDREVTKMTLARTAELEKRLKKTK